MFTGLKAETHFGRPQFEHFLDSLQVEHHSVSLNNSELALFHGVYVIEPAGLLCKIAVIALASTLNFVERKIS